MEIFQMLCGVFVIAVGIHCLPEDIHRPWGGGVYGVPVDVALIVLGGMLVMSA